MGALSQLAEEPKHKALIFSRKFDFRLWGVLEKIGVSGRVGLFKIIAKDMWPPHICPWKISTTPMGNAKFEEGKSYWFAESEIKEIISTEYANWPQ